MSIAEYLRKLSEKTGKPILIDTKSDFETILAEVKNAQSLPVNSELIIVDPIDNIIGRLKDGVPTGTITQLYGRLPSGKDISQTEDNA